jgi:hypothetical protein
MDLASREYKHITDGLVKMKTFVVNYPSLSQKKESDQNRKGVIK